MYNYSYHFFPLIYFYFSFESHKTWRKYKCDIIYIYIGCLGKSMTLQKTFRFHRIKRFTEEKSIKENSRE